MAGFSEDDIKYIQAIQDYMGYRLKGLPEFFYKTKDLNPSRRVRDTRAKARKES